MACLIPLLWGVNSKEDWKSRLTLWKAHWKHVLLFLICLVGFGSIQIWYWIYVTGSPLVYSYQDQGFKFFKPHLINGIFSYRSGWLIYTPVMVLAIAGMRVLFRQLLAMRLAVLLFTILFIWVTWSWNGWTYGGALGQRAMVQAYAVLAFPLGAMLAYIRTQRSWIRWLTGLFIGGCMMYNVWLTYHAHGGLLRPGEMTRAYFWKIFARADVPETAQFLLDTDEQYDGQPPVFDTLIAADFDDHIPECTLPTIQSSGCICIPSGTSEIVLASVQVASLRTSWVRAQADFQIEHREWDTWRQGQFTITLSNHGRRVKSRFIRPMRILQHKEGARVSVDIRVPSEAFDKIEVYYVTEQSTVPVLIDNVVLGTF